MDNNRYHASPAKWKSRLISEQNSDRTQKIQEGRARHRAETGQQQTTRRNGSPRAKDKPADRLTALGESLKADPADLHSLFQEWFQRLTDWQRQAREANRGIVYPDTVAGRQLERETIRLHRLLSDLMQHSAQGFLQGLGNGPPKPSEREPLHAAYKKAYDSGHEASQATARRARQRRNKGQKNRAAEPGNRNH